MIFTLSTELEVETQVSVVAQSIRQTETVRGKHPQRQIDKESGVALTYLIVFLYVGFSFQTR